MKKETNLHEGKIVKYLGRKYLLGSCIEAQDGGIVWHLIGQERPKYPGKRKHELPAHLLTHQQELWVDEADLR